MCVTVQDFHFVMSKDNPEKPEFRNLEINSEHILHTGMEPSWALRKWKGQKEAQSSGPSSEKGRFTLERDVPGGAVWQHRIYLKKCFFCKKFRFLSLAQILSNLTISFLLSPLTHEKEFLNPSRCPLKETEKISAMCHNLCGAVFSLQLIN